MDATRDGSGAETRPWLLDTARARGDERPVLAALIGADFSARSVTTTDADRGPAHIRSALAAYGDADLQRWSSLSEHIVLDLGDSRSHDNAWEGAWSEIILHARAAWEAAPFVIALGGDQTVTWPLATAARERAQRLGIVHVDCQRDIEAAGRGVTDRNVLRGIVDRDLVQGTDLVQVGLNRFANTWEGEQAAHARSIVGVTVEQLRTDGIAEAMQRALWSIRECDVVYASIDVEVLDRSFAPGSTNAFGGGLLPSELDQVVRAICSWPACIGLDIVEYDPTRDVAEITAHQSARIVMTAVATLAERASGTSSGRLRSPGLATS